jgi:hypothetical protein
MRRSRVRTLRATRLLPATDRLGQGEVVRRDRLQLGQRRIDVGTSALDDHGRQMPGTARRIPTALDPEANAVARFEWVGVDRDEATTGEIAGVQEGAGLHGP